MERAKFVERLQKVMSKAGVASRRESEKFIQEGRVKVNGKVVTEPGVKVEEGKDKILVDDKPIFLEEKVYFLLNKPRGVITSAKDERGRRTVVDLLADEGLRVYPVGRLDYNTEGVLLLTNDGELTNKLIHPKYKIKKKYQAKVKGIPVEEELDRLRVGVKLADGMTAPALVRLMEIDRTSGTAVLDITIHEGRNRQVRRMCEAIGYPVQSLKRTSFAMLTLTGLKRGGYRRLTEAEIMQLKGLNE